MKKLLLLFSILVLSILSFSSCNQILSSSDSLKNEQSSPSHDQSTHEHSFGHWTTKISATCTTKGEKYRICDICGAEESQETSPFAHDNEFISAIPADCVNPGKAAHYQCMHCDAFFDEALQEIETVAIIQPTGHYFEEWQVCLPATCGMQGSEKRSCACGETETRPIPATEFHTLSLNDATDADCENPATRTHFKCQVCQKYFDENTEEIDSVVIRPPLGHEYGTLVAEVPATCETDGSSTHYQCSRCNKYFAENKTQLSNTIIPAKGHNYGRLISGNLTSCTVGGTISHYQCSNCNQYFNQNKEIVSSITLLPKSHSFGSWITTKQATVSAEGSKYRQCSMCGQKETTTIPKYNPIKLSFKIEHKYKYYTRPDTEPKNITYTVKENNNGSYTVSIQFQVYINNGEDVGSVFVYLEDQTRKIRTSSDGGLVYATFYNISAGSYTAKLLCYRGYQL